VTAAHRLHVAMTCLDPEELAAAAAGEPVGHACPRCDELVRTQREIRDLARGLPRAIGALPGALRAAFVRVDLEGQPGRTAAAALGISQALLWRRVYEARTLVREYLHGGQP
jgi:DNA-directed RNA polymerase specialized sigma24 family protein